ncbi:immunoglobulin kappa light chain-like [Carcharodon carcharias]|uniref:immunoglobulin kappa light chain-like n=1 Tax=Carcharodon carcharias TaxID=13397 RepID=UPI001B7E1CF0|nr:immunoglobulin kappa light chain-like [Carcharodon carcharias]
MKLIYTAGKYLPAEGRFSSEISDKAGNYSLLIADTRRNDSGMYYCAIRNYQNRALIFGNGSQLVITEGSPTIFLLTPPEDEIASMERVPLLCLIRGLSPGPFPVRWNVSGWDIEGQADSGRIETDGTYTIRSYATLSAETWRSGAVCTCTVQINSSESLLSASVSSQRGKLNIDEQLTVSREQRENTEVFRTRGREQRHPSEEMVKISQQPARDRRPRAS